MLEAAGYDSSVLDPKSNPSPEVSALPPLPLTFVVLATTFATGLAACAHCRQRAVSIDPSGATAADVARDRGAQIGEKPPQRRATDRVHVVPQQKGAQFERPGFVFTRG